MTFMDIKLAAEYMGMTVRQLRHTVASRRIAHYKFGGRTSPLKFNKKDLDAYMEACRIEARRPARRRTV